MNDDAFSQALRLYEGAQYAEARNRFQQLVNAYPHHSELWLNLGNAEYRLNSLPLAEKHWRHALAMNPLEATAYLNLGNLYFRQERWTKALEAWQQFTQLKDTHVDVWLNLGLVYEKQGDLHRAMAAYSRFMAASPMARETVQLRRRFETAQKNADTCLARAEAAMAEGRLSEARQAFKQAFGQFPASAQASKAYAALLYTLNDRDGALKYYQIAHHLNEEDPVCLVNLGVIHEHRGQAFEACWAYHRALACQCAQPQVVRQRLESLRAAQPQMLDQAVMQARQWREKGDYAAATRRYAQLRQWPDLPASLQDTLTSGEEALALETNPVARAAATAFALGEEAYSAGRYDQALGHFTRYLELAPQGLRADEARAKKADIERQMGAVIQSMLRVDAVQRDVAAR